MNGRVCVWALAGICALGGAAVLAADAASDDGGLSSAQVEQLRKLLRSSDGEESVGSLDLRDLDANSFCSLFDDIIVYLRKRAKAAGAEPGWVLSELKGFRHLGRLTAVRQRQVAEVVAGMLAVTSDVNDCGDGCKILQMLGPNAAPALKQVQKVLASSGPFRYHKYHALHAVARMGPAGRVAMPEIKALLKDANSRSLAWAAMSRIAPETAEEAVKLIRSELQVKDSQDRPACAIEAASCMGKSASALLADLRAIAEDPNNGLQFEALIATGAVGDPKPVIGRLIEDLRDNDSETRVRACRGLVELQRFAGDALPVLREMLKRKDDDGLFYGGAITALTGKQPIAFVAEFHCIPGGYPWPEVKDDASGAGGK